MAEIEKANIKECTLNEINFLQKEVTYPNKENQKVNEVYFSEIWDNKEDDVWNAF
jgi:hypothetical protein